MRVQKTNATSICMPKNPVADPIADPLAWRAVTAPSLTDFEILATEV
jgi:hypothetical protein